MASYKDRFQAAADEAVQVVRERHKPRDNRARAIEVMREQCRRLAFGELRTMLNELRTVLRCESEPATVTDDGETFAANVLLRIPEAHKVSVTICPDYRCPDPSLRVEIAGCGRKFARTLAANDEVRIKDLASQALAEVAAAIASRIEAAKH